MKKSVLFLLGLVIAGFILLSGCSEDDGIEKQGDMPVLPPPSSMVMDFSSFPQNTSGRVTLAKSNYGLAALNVIFWQSILTTQLAIPLASFYEAFNHDLTYLSEEEKWRSEYTVTVGNQSITAELYAEKFKEGELLSKVPQVGDVIRWTMFLSSEGNFDRFIWFSGVSSVDGTGGEWTLFKGPSFGAALPLLTINWEREAGEVVYSGYRLVDEAADKYQSTIEYGLSEESGFTHFYDVSVRSEADEDYDLEILFNEVSKVGRVKSLAWFQDEAWRCWDENLDDAVCE